MKGLFVSLLAVFLGAFEPRLEAQIFLLPTPNRAIYEPNGEERYFVGTAGKPWMSGTFGCVRSEGNQMHEGLDIRCVSRDRHGEPTDKIFASAAGRVAYINTRPGLSNYGKYIVLRHLIEGLEIYTTYAHLSEIAPGLRVGDNVSAGQTIAVMGRTSNTHQPITKDRAHLHFEINLLVSERFSEWHDRRLPGQKNEHGNWNGRNLLGVDPRVILQSQFKQGSQFSLLRYIRQETELCRVLVRETRFPWLKRYTPLIKRNPLAEKEGVAGYEIALDFNGVAFQLIPRTAEEIKSMARVQMVSVNEDERARHPCRHLVTKKSGRWELTNNGLSLIDLMIF